MQNCPDITLYLVTSNSTDRRGVACQTQLISVFALWYLFLVNYPLFDNFISCVSRQMQKTQQGIVMWLIKDIVAVIVSHPSFIKWSISSTGCFCCESKTITTQFPTTGKSLSYSYSFGVKKYSHIYNLTTQSQYMQGPKDSVRPNIMPNIMLETFSRCSELKVGDNLRRLSTSPL